MKSITIDRRQALIGAIGGGLGMFTPDAAARRNAQEIQLPFKPEDTGNIHGRMLRRVSEKLAGTPINTEAGVNKLLDLLRELGVISQGDQKSLADVIRAIYHSADTKEMEQKIRQIYTDAVGKLGDVAVASISIARNSIEYAKDHPQTVKVVAADFTGALSGATVGAKLPRPFAVICVLGGAFAGSASAAFESKT